MDAEVAAVRTLASAQSYDRWVRYHQLHHERTPVWASVSLAMIKGAAWMASLDLHTPPPTPGAQVQMNKSAS